MTRDEICADFKTNVYDIAEAIDPHEEHDWHSLFIGYALAKGASKEEANDWATHARYTLHIA